MSISVHIIVNSHRLTLDIPSSWSLKLRRVIGIINNRNNVFLCKFICLFGCITNRLVVVKFSWVSLTSEISTSKALLKVLFMKINSEKPEKFLVNEHNKFYVQQCREYMTEKLRVQRQVRRMAQGLLLSLQVVGRSTNSFQNLFSLEIIKESLKKVIIIIRKDIKGPLNCTFHFPPRQLAFNVACDMMFQTIRETNRELGYGTVVQGLGGFQLRYDCDAFKIFKENTPGLQQFYANRKRQHWLRIHE